MRFRMLHVSSARSTVRLLMSKSDHALVPENVLTSGSYAGHSMRLSTIY